MYGFTIPVFGEGIVYDSPLEERQQQVKLLVHSMNTKGLEAMVPKMIDEAEEYFRSWGNEGEVEIRQVLGAAPGPPQHAAPRRTVHSRAAPHCALPERAAASELIIGGRRQVFSELIIMTASSCLMGPEIRENLSAEIARIYHSLDGGLTPLSTLWPGAPTHKHKERDEVAPIRQSDLI